MQTIPAMEVDGLCITMDYPQKVSVGQQVTFAVVMKNVSGVSISDVLFQVFMMIEMSIKQRSQNDVSLVGLRRAKSKKPDAERILSP